MITYLVGANEVAGLEAPLKDVVSG